MPENRSDTQEGRKVASAAQRPIQTDPITNKLDRAAAPLPSPAAVEASRRSNTPSADWADFLYREYLLALMAEKSDSSKRALLKDFESFVERRLPGAAAAEATAQIKARHGVEVQNLLQEHFTSEELKVATALLAGDAEQANAARSERLRILLQADAQQTEQDLAKVAEVNDRLLRLSAQVGRAEAAADNLAAAAKSSQEPALLLLQAKIQAKLAEAERELFQAQLGRPLDDVKFCLRNKAALSKIETRAKEEQAHAKNALADKLAKLNSQDLSRLSEAILAALSSKDSQDLTAATSALSAEKKAQALKAEKFQAFSQARRLGEIDAALAYCANHREASAILDVGALEREKTQLEHQKYELLNAPEIDTQLASCRKAYSERLSLALEIDSNSDESHPAAQGQRAAALMKTLGQPEASVDTILLKAHEIAPSPEAYKILDAQVRALSGGQTLGSLIEQKILVSKCAHAVASQQRAALQALEGGGRTAFVANRIEALGIWKTKGGALIALQLLESLSPAELSRLQEHLSAPKLGARYFLERLDDPAVPAYVEATLADDPGRAFAAKLKATSALDPLLTAKLAQTYQGLSGEERLSVSIAFEELSPGQTLKNTLLQAQKAQRDAEVDSAYKTLVENQSLSADDFCAEMIKLNLDKAEWKRIAQASYPDSQNSSETLRDNLIARFPSQDKSIRALSDGRIDDACVEAIEALSPEIKGSKRFLKACELLGALPEISGLESRMKDPDLAIWISAKQNGDSLTQTAAVLHALLSDEKVDGKSVKELIALSASGQSSGGAIQKLLASWDRVYSTESLSTALGRAALSEDFKALPLALLSDDAAEIKAELFLEILGARAELGNIAELNRFLANLDQAERTKLLTLAEKKSAEKLTKQLQALSEPWSYREDSAKKARVEQLQRSIESGHSLEEVLRQKFPDDPAHVHALLTLLREGPREQALVDRYQAGLSEIRLRRASLERIDGFLSEQYAKNLRGQNGAELQIRSSEQNKEEMGVLPWVASAIFSSDINAAADADIENSKNLLAIYQTQGHRIRLAQSDFSALRDAVNEQHQQALASLWKGDPQAASASLARGAEVASGISTILTPERVSASPDLTQYQQELARIGDLASHGISQADRAIVALETTNKVVIIAGGVAVVVVTGGAATPLVAAGLVTAAAAPGIATRGYLETEYGLADRNTAVKNSVFRVGGTFLDAWTGAAGATLAGDGISLLRFGQFARVTKLGGGLLSPWASGFNLWYAGTQGAQIASSAARFVYTFDALAGLSAGTYRLINGLNQPGAEAGKKKPATSEEAALHTRPKPAIEEPLWIAPKKAEPQEKVTAKQSPAGSSELPNPNERAGGNKSPAAPAELPKATQPSETAAPQQAIPTESAAPRRLPENSPTGSDPSSPAAPTRPGTSAAPSQSPAPDSAPAGTPLTPEPQVSPAPISEASNRPKDSAQPAIDLAAQREQKEAEREELRRQERLRAEQELQYRLLESARLGDQRAEQELRARLELQSRQLTDQHAAQVRELDDRLSRQQRLAQEIARQEAEESTRFYRLAQSQAVSSAAAAALQSQTQSDLDRTEIARIRAVADQHLAARAESESLSTTLRASEKRAEPAAILEPLTKAVAKSQAPLHEQAARAQSAVAHGGSNVSALTAEGFKAEASEFSRTSQAQRLTEQVKATSVQQLETSEFERQSFVKTTRAPESETQHRSVPTPTSASLESANSRLDAQRQSSPSREDSHAKLGLEQGEQHLPRMKPTAAKPKKETPYLPQNAQVIVAPAPKAAPKLAEAEPPSGVAVSHAIPPHFSQTHQRAQDRSARVSLASETNSAQSLNSLTGPKRDALFASLTENRHAPLARELHSASLVSTTRTHEAEIAAERAREEEYSQLRRESETAARAALHRRRLKHERRRKEKAKALALEALRKAREAEEREEDAISQAEQPRKLLRTPRRIVNRAAAARDGNNKPGRKSGTQTISRSISRAALYRKSKTARSSEAPSSSIPAKASRASK